jgi:monoamine oxidase
MGNAIKVWAVFSRQFWPEDMWDVVVTHRLFPEFWICQYPTDIDRNPPNPPVAGEHEPRSVLYCATAFVCGTRADDLAKYSDPEKVNLLVELLDEVFGSRELDKPATEAFVRGAAIDWRHEPFIEGGYSSPSVGSRVGDRNVIAAPEGGVLFFAGEHTNPCLNPCLQGAMETGDRAAAQVLLALRKRQTVSKL